MKQRRILLAALAVLAASSTPLQAQRIDSPYRFLDHGQHVGGWVGYIAAEDGRIGIGPESGMAFGLSWALRVSGPFSIGVDAGYLPTTRTVRDTVFVEADSMYRSLGEADVSLLMVMGNLRFNATGARTWNGLQPFALLGAGAAIDLAGTATVERDTDPTARYDFGTSFAGLLGAGVDWFPTSRVSVRVDARNLLWKLGVPEAYRRTQRGRTLPGSEWEQNLAVTAGLSIHF